MEIKSALVSLLPFIREKKKLSNKQWSPHTTIDSNNGFSVEYHETYKVLTNLITNEKYALVCCNNSLTNFTTGYHAALNTPLNTVGIATELDSLPFFEVSCTSIYHALESSDLFLLLLL